MQEAVGQGSFLEGEREEVTCHFSSTSLIIHVLTIVSDS